MENKKIREIIRQLNDIYKGSPWIGTNFEQKIDSLSEAMAFNCPLKNLNCIAEIISHLCFWLKESIVAIKTGKSELTYKSEDNWRDLQRLKKESWATIKAEYYQLKYELISLLQDKEDTFLNEVYYDSDYEKQHTYQFLIEGMIHHDLYHLGQIALVLKLTE